MEKTMQENIMSLMSDYLEMLEFELKDAWATLGQASSESLFSHEDSISYYAKKNACAICKAKVTLMKKIIASVSSVLDSTPVKMSAKL